LGDEACNQATPTPTCPKVAVAIGKALFLNQQNQGDTNFGVEDR